MKATKSTVTIVAICSDDGNHRYLLRRQWDKEKPEAAVVMINPTTSDDLSPDLTSMLVQKNVAKLGFGAVSIINLYSYITPKISVRWFGDDELSNDDNDKEIEKAAQRADTVIIAWGTFGHSTQRVQNRKEQVLKILKENSSHICCIADQQGRTGLHPLTPSVRSSWRLEDYDDKDQNGT